MRNNHEKSTDEEGESDAAQLIKYDRLMRSLRLLDELTLNMSTDDAGSTMAYRLRCLVGDELRAMPMLNDDASDARDSQY